VKAKDLRLTALGVTAVTIIALGAAIKWYEQYSSSNLNVVTGKTEASRALTNFADHARDKRREEVDDLFQKAVIMLHSKQYDYAVVALHRVLELAPRMPEAHVNMGFAMLGRGDYSVARDFFQSAIDLKPQQVNAYYGLAEALEHECDIAGAIGAMRTYVHLAQDNDPYLRKARSALWEWESARNANSPTKDAGSCVEKSSKQEQQAE
jgi:tetratricopeptide (TPR) repeat protein